MKNMFEILQDTLQEGMAIKNAKELSNKWKFDGDVNMITCIVQFLDYEAQELGKIRNKKLLKCEDCIFYKQKKCKGWRYDGEGRNC